METFKDIRFLRQLNKYGGLIKDMGHIYIDIINNHYIIVRSAKDSIYHLYEYEDETIIMEIDIENNIPKKYHDEILWNIKDSFGSQYAYNYSNYDILKINIFKCFHSIKKKINNQL
jgi:hypothetical protein